MKKAILFIAGLILGTFLCGAQNYQIRGIVKDSHEEPVVGAVVMLEGNTKVTSVTDAAGKFSISVPSSAKNPVLNFSCLSFKDQSVALTGNDNLVIVMEDANEQLGEAVVVGYGSMRRSDLTGSVTSVKMDENMASQAASLDQFLQGKAAGVQVVSNSAAPGAGVSVRIRGMSTFSGSTEPLYVVDGVLLNTSASTTLMTADGAISDSNDKTNELMGINPQDIASIEILKDASATAIYGSQGANGVVLITTKSAQRDRPVVKLTLGAGMERRYKKMDVLSFEEYMDYVKVANPSFDFSRIYADPLFRRGLLVEPVDWQDFVERDAWSENVYLSVSGRPKKTSYWFSVGANNKQGIIKKTGFRNYTIRLNLDRTISKKVKIGIKTGISYLDSDMTQGSSAGTHTASASMMRSMVVSRPFRYGANVTEEDELERIFLTGPDRWMKDYQENKMEIRVNPSAYLEWKIFPSLTFKSNLGADYRTINQYKFRSNRINYSTTGSIGAKGYVDQLYYNWSNMFMFNKKIGKHHNISGTLGSEYTSNNGTTQTVEGWNIEQYKALIASINSAPFTKFTYSNWDNALMSFYLRAIYNWHDRHVITATFRMDGSSKFQGANKWASFPSFAYAWRMSEESWFKESLPKVSMLKFRLGWGRVGNQSIRSYQTLQNFANTLYPDHSADNPLQANVGMYPSNIMNDKLKWETSEQFNGGIDFGLFKGRFTLSADAYQKITKDLLQYKWIPASSGFTGMWMNYGTIENKGLEFTLEAVPVKTRLIEWTVNGNISFNRNKVLAIGTEDEGEDIWVAEGKQAHASYFYGGKIGNSTYVTAPLNIFIEGYPMGVFYGLKSTGIVQNGETGTQIGDDGSPRPPGAINYIDANGDGYISENDRIIIGDPNPDFTFGFGTSLSIGKFTLSAEFNGSWGNDIFNINKVVDTHMTSYSTNVLKESYYRAWTPENGETFYPAIGAQESIDFNAVTSRFVEDGSYLRLANVSVSYDFPIKKTGFVKGVNLTVNGNNLIFWTKYSGMDPDVNSFGSVDRMGADMGSYPGARGYNFRLNLTF